MGLKVRGKHGHAAIDPSKTKMPGRRRSSLTTFKLVDFDEGITATQVPRDLELSDLEDELVSVDGSFLTHDWGRGQ